MADEISFEDMNKLDRRQSGIGHNVVNHICQ